MKFIHCADLHLNSKIDGIPTEKSSVRREEIVRTFERLCEYATNNSIEAIIIAGDMFDVKKVSQRVKNRVISAIANAKGVDFLCLAGNHDENLLDVLGELPENVKTFSNSWVKYTYDMVDIYGLDLNKENQNLLYDGLIINENRINIVALHGQIAGYKTNDDAEVISIPRLKEKGIDYLALGHIHSYVKEKLDNRGVYVYSGCLDGRGFDELGDKGFSLIEVENGVLSSEFVKFSSRNLYEYKFSVENYDNWYDAQSKILEEVEKKYTENSLIKVVLEGEYKKDFDIDLYSLNSRLKERFFFAKVYDKTKFKVDIEDFKYDKTIKGEFVKTVFNSDLDDEEKNKVILLGLKALKGEEF